ncbi:MAG: bacteriophage holin [Candidatus Binataceae bacterium]
MKGNVSAQTAAQTDINYLRLNVKACALTCGLIWGIGLFLLTWWIMAFDGATGEATLIGEVYRGYSISPMGSLVGLVWATLDGLAGGVVIAWLYNLLAERMR